MPHNKFLYDIYKSVKTLNINKINTNINKINTINKINKNPYILRGGTKESDEDYTNIMENLGLIEEDFLKYFESLQKYIDIYLKNAKEFEKLLQDRLSIQSLEKLKEAMTQLNLTLGNLK